MFHIRTNHCALIVFSGIILLSFTANAMDIQPNVSLAMQYTDNATKVANNEVNDLIVITSVGANIDAASGPFQLDADTSLKYTNYTHDTFDTQQYFHLNAIAGWEMLKDRLDWKLRDFFTQQSIDSLAPSTPYNIQNTNVLTFGPNLHSQISDRQSITIKPEYRQYTYQAQNIDNQQDILDISWAYQLFRTMSVGVRGGVNKIDYDDPLLTDYTFRNIHLTLSSTHADYDYTADIGSTRIDRQNNDSIRGITGNMRWSFNINGYSTLRAYIASDLTDANNNLLNASANPDDGDLAYAQTSSEILRNNILRLTYKRNDATLSSNVWFELHKQDYEYELFGQKVKAAGFELNYPVTAVLSTGIYTSYRLIELTDIDRNDTEYSIGGNIKFRLSRKLLGTVDIKYYDKDSSIDTADFKETNILLSLVYGYGS